MNNQKKDVTNLKEVIIGAVVAEGIKGVREVGNIYVSNYTKRRNVGFNVMPSLSGAASDTVNYYSSIIKGEEPIIMQEAIYFEEDK